MQTLEMPKKTVVDCNTWCRGVFVGFDGSGSALLTKNKTRCCLGFACSQAGITDTFLFRCASPGGLNVHVTRLIEQPGKENSDNSMWTTNAMNINDDEAITDKERMRQLTAYWKKLGEGYSVEFINVPEQEE